MSANESPYAWIAGIIAAEALAAAIPCADHTIEGWGPICLYATNAGTWQIHNTSKLINLDAAVPLTSASPASVEALTAALIQSFETTAACRAANRVAVNS